MKSKGGGGGITHRKKQKNLAYVSFYTNLEKIVIFALSFFYLRNIVAINIQEDGSL